MKLRILNGSPVAELKGEVLGNDASRQLQIFRLPAFVDTTAGKLRFAPRNDSSVFSISSCPSTRYACSGQKPMKSLILSIGFCGFDHSEEVFNGGVAATLVAG